MAVRHDLDGASHVRGRIRGRRLESGYAGLSTVGAEFQANTQGYDRFDIDPAIDAAPNGQFIVVWARDDFFDNTMGIVGRLMNSDGTTVGDDFVANTYDAGPFTIRVQNNSALAINGSGQFLVCWDSDGSTGDDTMDTSIAAAHYLLNPSIFADGFESGNVSAWSDSIP